MKFAIRPGLGLALTLLCILAVYFQAISHPFSLFDDPGIVEHFGINSAVSFLDVISPGTGIYYRPIISLSYWLDYQLWEMLPTFMHLENIVAHLINVLLVFQIASRLPFSSETKAFPYLSALLFGLHPINSESVNWISGRTDLLAGMFIFFAVYCLIRSIQEQSRRFAIYAFGTALLGALTKETAIMFIPAALLVIKFWPDVSQDVTRYRAWRTRYLLVSIVISFCVAASILIMVYVKGRGNSPISIVFEGSTNVFIRSFEAFGFYAKKIFLPLPLNMAIVEVNPLYAIFGIITLAVLFATFKRLGIPGIFLALSTLFTLPALIIASTSFAWTPFGERYLYIPSAFAVIGSLECFHRILGHWNRVKWFLPIVSVVIALFSIATFQRSLIWGDNLAFMEDMVAKSPNFGVARNQYGGLLKLAGRYDEAKNQYIIASQQNNNENVSRVIRLNLIWLEIDGESLDETRRILLSKFISKAEADIELLIQINRVDELLLNKAESLEERKKLAADIFETNENLFLRTGEPFYLYRSGQISLFVNDYQKAASYFRKAYNDPRLKEYYRESALRLAEKMDAK
jgi:hypothetical protein